MKLNSIVKWNEFLAYFFIGGTATILDWGIFWLTVSGFGFHYEAGLMSSYMLAGIFHFFANKLITFQCQSDNLGSQYTLYICLTLSSLLISMGIIAVLINIFTLNSMVARMITTGIMLIPNYLLHKHITFNKRFFTTSHSIS